MVVNQIEFELLESKLQQISLITCNSSYLSNIVQYLKMVIDVQLPDIKNMYRKKNFCLFTIYNTVNQILSINKNATLLDFIWEFIHWEIPNKDNGGGDANESTRHISGETKYVVYKVTLETINNINEREKEIKRLEYVNNNKKYF